MRKTPRCGAQLTKMNATSLRHSLRQHIVHMTSIAAQSVAGASGGAQSSNFGSLQRVRVYLQLLKTIQSPSLYCWTSYLAFG